MSIRVEPNASEDHDDRAEQRVDAVIAQSGLVGLSTLSEIIDRVATLRGKPIQLEQVGDSEWGTLTGLWIETPAVSRIFVRRTDPVAYQVVCALHEVMHILLNHPSCLPAPAERDTFLLHGPHRARTTGPRRLSTAEAVHETEAEYGARTLAQALLHESEDPAERLFG